MAVTRTSRAIVLTALNDAVAYPIKVASVALVGTGMTPGQRLTIGDNNGTTVLVDHYVQNENEDAEFLVEYEWLPGFVLLAVPAGGTWTVTIRLK